MATILVTGGLGQLGIELVPALQRTYGRDRVIVTDLRSADGHPLDGHFELLDATDASALQKLIEKHRITQIYHLAAVLSATAEQHPLRAWQVNMESLLHVLEAARHFGIDQVYWPSSIGVFGPETPKTMTPQYAPANPLTTYGISKLAGERWCAYYHQRYGLDVRSLRYPGLIGYSAQPGGGTTDYAVDIFFQAVEKGRYTCYLKPDTRLPMMYMDDAVKATIRLMEAPRAALRVDFSYNLAGMSFTPQELAAAIRNVIPGFEIEYAPDFRQQIADSWPQSIDDGYARQDWGWNPEFDLDRMVAEMLHNIRRLRNSAA
jgi:nucleoside-diphosphate-sugar epimerase